MENGVGEDISVRIGCIELIYESGVFRNRQVAIWLEGRGSVFKDIGDMNGQSFFVI